MRITVKTLHGLEEILAAEIAEIGGTEIKILKRAVAFEGDHRLLYRANFELRTAMRVLVPINVFRARNENQLYQKIRRINWSNYMDLDGTLAIDGVTHGRLFTHSKYVALKTKDAIVDQWRDKTGKRPNVDTEKPSLRVNVYINEDVVTVSLDSSGQSLHKRGYRVDVLEAPISEVLAAGMIKLSGWDAQSDLIDPMCGSATIPIEAALIATNTPAGMFKDWFGFETWNDFEPATWKAVQEEALANVRPFEHQIWGTDESPRAMRIAQLNVEAARMEKHIQLKRTKFERLERPFEKGTIIMNPPYDERLENVDIKEFYKMIGDQFKAGWQGYTAWLISSNMQALKCIGLRPSKKIVLFNGALECKYQKFEMYAGSRKKKYQNQESVEK